MRILGIQAIYPTKKRLTSIKHPEHKIYEYLLKQYWTTNDKKKTVYVPTPNEVWSGDIYNVPRKTNHLIKHSYFK